MSAYQEGYYAAKRGDNINNCYPYIKGNGYWDWLDGYRDYLNKVKQYREFVALGEYIHR